MRLKGLMEPLVTSEKFSGIMRNIEEGNNPVEVAGLSESSKAYFANAIYESLDKPVVIITHSDMEAKNLYEDLNLYTNNVSYFPAKEVVFYNVDAISGDLRWARLRVIEEILERKKGIVVTAIDAFASEYTPRKLFKEHKLSLKIGKDARSTPMTSVTAAVTSRVFVMTRPSGIVSSASAFCTVVPVPRVFGRVYSGLRRTV